MLLRQLSAGGGIAGAIAVAEEGGVVAFGTQGARRTVLQKAE
ncbi:MAG: hypothetical protein Q4A02_07315 [Bacteroidales bacterium]|nr:hypothetical protein [Bacteroidales bacterium]